MCVVSCLVICSLYVVLFFFFNDTATTEIYTLSLHDALPISSDRGVCAGEQYRAGSRPSGERRDGGARAALSGSFSRVRRRPPVERSRCCGARAAPGG